MSIAVPVFRWPAGEVPLIAVTSYEHRDVGRSGAVRAAGGDPREHRLRVAVDGPPAAAPGDLADALVRPGIFGRVVAAVAGRAKAMTAATVRTAWPWATGFDVRRRGDKDHGK
jgi:hypothetical protein